MRLAIFTFTFATFTAAALVAVTSCNGDDGGSGSTDAGNTCEGVYADKTLDEITAGATTGACTSAADLDAVCANDVNGTTSACALTCNGQGGTDAEKVVCTSDCVKDELDPAPSDACIGCYIASVSCSLANCLDPCLAGGSDPDCIDCRVEFGCAGAFYNECSGLPVPTGLDLGSGGAGGSSSGGASNGGSAGSAAGGASSGAGGAP
jgi:hypothetical protein